MSEQRLTIVTNKLACAGALYNMLRTTNDTDVTCTSEYRIEYNGTIHTIVATVRDELTAHVYCAVGSYMSDIISYTREPMYLTS